MFFNMQNKYVPQVSWPTAERLLTDGSNQDPIWPDNSDLQFHDRWPVATDLAASERQSAEGAEQTSMTKVTEALGAASIQAPPEPSEIPKTAAEIAAEERERKIEHYLDKAAIITYARLNAEAKKPGVTLDGNDSTMSGYSYAFEPKSQTLVQQAIRAGYNYSGLIKNSEHMIEDFAKRGIYEVCTIRREQVPSLASVTYEAHGPGYREEISSGKLGRDGLVQTVKYLLSPEDANALANDVARDPMLIRDMSDRHMARNVFSEEALAPGGDRERYARPPYSAWDARPERTMAIRTSFDQDPDHVVKMVHF
jgi:hypothetical protein